MKIEERLVRQSPADVVEIGEVIERAYYGQFGAVLKAIIEGLMTEGLTYHTRNEKDVVPLSADRILGRLEGYQRIISEIEASIEKKNELLKPQKEDEDDEEEPKKGR